MHTGMARNLGFLVLLLSIASICSAAIFNPISDSHRSAALELFAPSDGSFGSTEETYEALRTFEILGIESGPDVKASICKSVSDILLSPSSDLNDLFNALRLNGLLKCEFNEEALTGIASRLKDSVNDANSLLDFYYSIGSLVLIKDLTSEVDVLLGDANGVFRSIKALSQSDGRWRYSSNNPEPSTYAAGIALDTLAGVVSLASSEVDKSLIGIVKNDIVKLFDSIERYGDGTNYFDEKHFDGQGNQGPVSATSSVVHGLTAFATATSESLNLSGDKILGLAKFLLGIGVPGNAKDFYYQTDALACLENNRVAVPLILSLPAVVLSLTRKDQLKREIDVEKSSQADSSPIVSRFKHGTLLLSHPQTDGRELWNYLQILRVRVTTVLGSPAPPLSVKLMQVFVSGSKDASVINQELKYDPETAVHFLDALPASFDVGNYVFTFEIVLHDTENKKIYATGGRTKVPIYLAGVVKVENAEIAVIDSDLGSIETQKKLDLAGENAVALSANHLQKLRLSFQLTSPLGHVFKPHQAFLILRHETKVEHIFVVGHSGKQFEIVLDFLRLVEKLFYLSGSHDIELAVGDAVMENSFLQRLGQVELDLPEPPEKATKPPPQPVDLYLRYGPKSEITHIFRVPEKLPPRELSLAFLGLVFLPLLGFLVGIFRFGINLGNFPSAMVPATFAILFHLGIAAVLSLYVLFWLKLDLFTTLKTLGLLGVFLMFVGHRTLSHLASNSAKLKSA